MAGWSDTDLLEAMFRCRTLGQSMGQAALVMASSRSAIAGAIKRMTDAAWQLDGLALQGHEILRLVAAVIEGRADADAMAKVFAKARGVPVGRQAMLYQVWVVLHDAAQAGPSEVLNPGNDDQVAWPQWWRPVAQVGVAA
jgi:hypothetical protein